MFNYRRVHNLFTDGMKTSNTHTNQTLIKHLTYILFGGVIGILLFTFLFYNEPDLWLAYGHVILGAGLVGIVQAYLLVIVSDFLGRLIGWERQPGFGLLLTLLINLSLVYAISAAYVYVYGFSLTGFISQDVYIKLAILVFILVLIYAVIHQLIRSHQHLQQSALDHVKLETRQIDLQLTALKAQLTPHFLFNSFNTISSLLHKDLDTSEQYIRNLAAVYQYTLPSYARKLVSFSEEWSFVKANLDLMLVRFGGHLDVQLEDEMGIIDIKMPPLTLQLLIENALKHNVINSTNSLTIRIARSGQKWSVSNNVTSKPNQVQSFKVGLGNIRERYQLLCQKSIEVRNNHDFTVILPVL